MKRILSTFCAMSMAVMMACTAFAAGSDATITLNGTNGGTYGAYQVFSATTSGENIGYKLNPDFSGFFEGKIGGDTGFASAVAYVEAQKTSSEAAALADALMAYAKAQHLTPMDTGTETLNVDKGYYLIFNQSTEGTATRAMLEVTTESESISVKESAPTLIKKVFDESKNGWYDIADFAPDTDVSFKLTGSITSLEGYQKYTYVMHDTLSKGLDYKALTSVKFFNGSGDDITSTVTAKGVTWNLVEDSANGFDLTFNNMLKLKGTGAVSIEVLYTATATKDLVIADKGNINTANLTYSNDPYYTEDTETTPDDVVIVYTYELDLNKVDALSKEALAGAEFMIYKDEGLQHPLHFYEKKTTPNGVAEGEALVIYGVTADDSATGYTDKLTVNSKGQLFIEGLDATTYHMVETKAPDGYNAIIGSFPVSITADYKDKLNNFMLSDAGKFELTSSHEVLEKGILVTVENSVGGTLPQTGGSGTIMFKVVGASVAVVGLALVVVFVMKKDKKKEDQ